MARQAGWEGAKERKSVYEISAQVNIEEARLCKMLTRVFEGYVKVAKDERVEKEDGTIDFISHEKRVMDVETIRAGLAFRVKVSRAGDEAGIKTPLGTIVGERGLEELLLLERNLKERALEIQDEMRQSLQKHQAEEGLAKCEVELVVLKLEADAVSRESVDRLVQESVDRQLEESVDNINQTVRSIRAQVEIGNVPRASRQTSTLERELENLARRGWRADQLEPLYADLERVREILRQRQMLVPEKLAELQKVALMEGITPKFGAGLRLAAA